MERIKVLGAKLCAWAKRPGVWAPVLILALVTAGSLALARLVIAPTILASNDYTVPPPVKRIAKRTEIGETKTRKPGANRRPTQSPTSLPPGAAPSVRVIQEPLIQISMVETKRSKPKRKRYRRSRSQRPENRKPAADVVYRARRDAPSFADPGSERTEDEPRLRGGDEESERLAHGR